MVRKNLIRLFRYRITSVIIAIIIIFIVTIGQLVYNQDENGKTEPDVKELSEEPSITFIKTFLESEDVEKYNKDEPPKIFQGIDFAGFRKDELKEFLPSEWSILKFSKDDATLIYLGDEPVDEDNDILKEGYVGVYRDKITIYSDKPPNGEVVEITPYEVKEVYLDELKEGIKFDSQNEKERILESYTS